MLDERAFLPLDLAEPPFGLPPGLATVARVRVFEPPAALVRQGEVSDRLFVIERGAVEWSVSQPSGRTATLGLLGPGDVVGLEATADAVEPVGGPGYRMGSAPFRTGLVPAARAFTTVRAACLPVRVAVQMARTSVDTAEWLAGAWVRRGMLLERRLASTVAVPVVDRVLQVLRELTGPWGQPTLEGIRIGLPLHQDCLASLAGVTRESVNRALRRLAGSGLVVRYGRFYTLRGCDAPEERDPTIALMSKAGCGQAWANRSS